MTTDRFNDDHGGRYRTPVPEMQRELLITAIQTEVADMMASAIDAGSERDAVMEDEVLHAALRELVEGWIFTE